MSGDRNLERLLGVWLEAEAPSGPPASLRDDIVARTARVRPRPAWLATLLGGHPAHGRAAMAGAALRLVPVLLTAVLVLALVWTAAMVGARLFRSSEPPGIQRLTMADPPFQVIVADDGAIWASSVADPLRFQLGSIARVDMESQTLTPVVTDLPPGHLTFVVLGGSIWASHDEGGTLLRWDAETGESLATIRTGARPLEPLGAFGSVWQPLFDDRALARHDAATGVTTRIELGGQPLFVEGGWDSIWVVLPYANQLVAVDPATNMVRLRIPMAHQTCAVGVAGGLVWAIGCAASDVDVFDADDGTFVGTFSPGGKVTRAIEHDGLAWLLTESEGRRSELVAVDPETLQQVAVFDPGVSIGVHALGPDALWIGSEDQVVAVPLELLSRAGD